MGDIEKFFNDNFFKKVSSEPDHMAADMQIKRDFEEERKEFMHGVPESAYEPTVMPENDNEKQHMSYKANDPFRAAVRRKGFDSKKNRRPHLNKEEGESNKSHICRQGAL